MAHALTQRADGKTEFAFLGDRKNIWHGLGQELQEGQTVDQWKEAAGMDWEVFSSKVMYQAGLETKTMDDKKVLFRSDSQDAMSVVGADYKVVQPAQVLEFFNDLTQVHGMKLSAAGTIFGGRRFWATAEIGENFETVKGDKIGGQLLLATSIDGTLSTIAKVVATRTVCANTLSVAIGETTKNIVKVSHRSTWDANQVKLDLGLISEGWSTFAANMKKLAEIELTDNFVNNYFTSKMYDKNKTAEDQSWGTIKTVNSLMSLYKGGLGAEFAPNTAYNVLNAVTEFTDHYGIRKVDAGRKFVESSFGKGDDLKTSVLDDMLALAA